MTVSILVFVFGLVISGIVALGVMNARELARQESMRQTAYVRHQSDWYAMRDQVARRHSHERRQAA